MLQEQAWTTAPDEAGFTRISIDVLPSTAKGPHTADMQLVTTLHRP
ncbi:hypothetical protein [Streptomyces sp. NPDC093707]